MRDLPLLVEVELLKLCDASYITLFLISFLIFFFSAYAAIATIFFLRELRFLSTVNPSCLNSKLILCYKLQLASHAH